MKKLLLTSFFYFLIFGCNNENQESTNIESKSVIVDSINSNQDSIRVLDLIRKVMIWQDSKDRIEPLPLKGNDSNICIGVDYEIQKENTNKLQVSNYFTKNFIQNYEKIINRIDEIIRNGEVEPFDIAEMAPFNFSTDASPWCNCQDNLDWNKIEFKEFKLNQNTCEFKWHWKDWKGHSYWVKATKENNVWRTDKMEGFDYNIATKI